MKTSRYHPRRPTRDLEFFMGRYELEGQATPNNIMFDDLDGLLDPKFGGRIRSIPGVGNFFFSPDFN